MKSNSMIKHIVMWTVAGANEQEKAKNKEIVRAQFETLRGKINGMQHMEIGIDTSRVDYACDVVLYTEFASQAALDVYATHPDHLRVKAALEGLRTSRHQVDYSA
jgi:Stress responsive A/B Barrel Domain